MVPSSHSPQVPPSQCCTPCKQLSTASCWAKVRPHSRASPSSQVSVASRLMAASVRVFSTWQFVSSSDKMLTATKSDVKDLFDWLMIVPSNQPVCSPHANVNCQK